MAINIKYQDWLNLPKQEREKFGFYIWPQYCILLTDYNKYKEYFRQNYPFQFLFREFCSSFYYKVLGLKEIWYGIKKFFFPCHSMVRKAIPNKWTDTSELIRIVNFALLKEFYYQEYSLGYIEFEADFKTWIEDSINYIEKERPKLEEKLDAAYPQNTGILFDDCVVDYKSLYGEVERLEKLIEEKDTKVLNEIINYRQKLCT